MIMNDVIDRVIPDLYRVIRLPDVRRTIFRRGDKRMGKRSVYRLVYVCDQLVCRFRVAQMQIATLCYETDKCCKRVSKQAL